jgi:hypothetical protein
LEGVALETRIGEAATDPAALIDAPVTAGNADGDSGGAASRLLVAISLS